MNSYYIWFALFAIISYFIVTDNSVARAFYMLSQLVRFQYEKTKWWILHNPANPVVKWLVWRRSYKLAKQLEKEFNQRD
jgi:hypothetical protein